MIKLVVPFVPGSPVDVLARVVSQQMTTRLGQSVVIENRPGAGTSTATKQVQSSPADGYTLLMMGQNLVYVGLLYPDIGFDPVKSFAPVATLAGWSHVMLVANNVPAKSVKELVAYAKANPGKVTFGYGLGTSPQIVGKSFELAAGLDLINVPYKGGEQVRVDLLGGRIHINFAPVSNALAMIQEGKVRALAVTSAARDPELPDVPTFKERRLPRRRLRSRRLAGDRGAARHAGAGRQQAQRRDQRGAALGRGAGDVQEAALPADDQHARAVRKTHGGAGRALAADHQGGGPEGAVSSYVSTIPSFKRRARVAAAVRQRQIGFRAHLDQPRRRALELLRLVAFVGEIKLIGLGGGGGHELHRVIVERVDQDDEALGLVALGEIHHRNPVEHDRMELVRDAQIVGRRQRLLAEVMKRKARDAHGRAWHPHAAALHGQLARRAADARR